MARFVSTVTCTFENSNLRATLDQGGLYWLAWREPMLSVDGMVTPSPRNQCEAARFAPPTSVPSGG